MNETSVDAQIPESEGSPSAETGPLNDQELSTLHNLLARAHQYRQVSPLALLPMFTVDTLETSPHSGPSFEQLVAEGEQRLLAERAKDDGTPVEDYVKVGIERAEAEHRAHLHADRLREVTELTTLPYINSLHRIVEELNNRKKGKAGIFAKTDPISTAIVDEKGQPLNYCNFEYGYAQDVVLGKKRVAITRFSENLRKGAKMDMPGPRLTITFNPNRSIKDITVTFSYMDNIPGLTNYPLLRRWVSNYQSTFKNVSSYDTVGLRIALDEDGSKPKIEALDETMKPVRTSQITDQTSHSTLSVQDYSGVLEGMLSLIPVHVW